MDLLKYYNKRVCIKDIHGLTTIGKVNDYCYPEDNEHGKESIIVDCEEYGTPFEFWEDNIASIEIL